LHHPRSEPEPSRRVAASNIRRHCRHLRVRWRFQIVSFIAVSVKPRLLGSPRLFVAGHGVPESFVVAFDF